MSPEKCAEEPDSGCDIESFVSFLDDRGLSDTPVWVTEFGWSTHDDFSGMQSWQRGVGEKQQARYTAAMLASFGEIPQIEAAFIYRDRDFADADPHLNASASCMLTAALSRSTQC